MDHFGQTTPEGLNQVYNNGQFSEDLLGDGLPYLSASSPLSPKKRKKLISYDPTSGRKVKLERPLILNIASNTEIKQTVHERIAKYKRKQIKQEALQIIKKIEEANNKQMNAIRNVTNNRLLSLDDAYEVNMKNYAKLVKVRKDDQNYMDTKLASFFNKHSKNGSH